MSRTELDLLSAFNQLTYAEMMAFAQRLHDVILVEDGKTSPADIAESIQAIVDADWSEEE